MGIASTNSKSALGRRLLLHIKRFLSNKYSLVFLLITSFPKWESSSSSPLGGGGGGGGGGGEQKKIFKRGGGGGGGGGAGGTQKSFIQGGSVSPRFDSLPFYIPFFTEKVPLSCTVY